MKLKIMSTTAIALFMAISFTTIAQNEPKGNEKILQQVKLFTGQLSSWVHNDDYVYDGFYLQTNTEKFLVKFPSNIGSQLTKSIKTGNTISVKGFERTDTLGKKEIKLISITADGKNIYEVIPKAYVSCNKNGSCNGSGKINELQKDNHNVVKGFVLDNKTILHVPSHIAEQLNNVALVNANISYSGVKQELNVGEVAASNYTIIHCQTITIKGVKYFLK